MHLNPAPLRPKETLYYILRELKQGTSHLAGNADFELLGDFYKKLHIKYEKERLLREIKTSIAEMKVDEKLEKIEKDIRDRLRRLKTKGMVDQLLLVDLKHLELEVLLPLLLQSAAAAAQAQQGLLARNKVMHKLARAYDSIITETAKKLKGLMDVEEAAAAAKQQMVPICLDDDQYERILQDVFLKTTTSKPLQAKEDTKPTRITLGEDQNKTMILEEELEKGKPDKNQATSGLGGQGQIPEYDVEEIVPKIESIKRELKKRLKIQGIVNRINIT